MSSPSVSARFSANKDFVTVEVMPKAGPSRPLITGEEQPLVVKPVGIPTSDQKSEAKKGKKQVGNSEYHKAAYFCNTEKVKKLIERDGVHPGFYFKAVSTLNDFKENCLDSLVRSNVSQEQKLEFLDALFSLPDLDKGQKKRMGHIQLNMLTNENNWCFTAMEKAAYQGQLLLLKRMICIYRSVGGESMATDKTESGSENLSAKTPIPSPKTKLEKTLLHSAADGNAIEVAAFLLEIWKEDLHAQDHKGFTPLHKAARFKHKEMTNFLLETKGVSLNVFDKSGKTPIYYIVGVPGTEPSLLKKLDQTFIKEDKDTVLFDPGSAFIPCTGPTEGQETSVLAQLTELQDEVVKSFLLHPAVQIYLELKLQRMRFLHYTEMLALFVQFLLFTALVISAGIVRIVSLETSMNDTKINNTDQLLSLETSMNVTKIRDANPPLANITCAFAGVLCLMYLILFICYAVGRCKKIREDETDVIIAVRKRTLRMRMLYCFCSAMFHLMMLILICLEISYVKSWIAIYLLALLTNFFWKYQSLSVSGKYKSMLVAVIIAFLKILFSFLPLFLGFILAFSVLFDNPLLELPTGIMTFFAMIVGEFNLGELFKDPSTYVHYTAPLFVTVFVILLGIVMMNLWISLCIVDIADLHKFGKLQHTKSIITRIGEMEVLLWFSERLDIFHGTNGKIKLSLRDPTSIELDSIIPREQTFCHKVRHFFAFRLFKVGIVFAKTSLKEQYPLPKSKQLLLEKVMERRAEQME